MSTSPDRIRKSHSSLNRSLHRVQQDGHGRTRSYNGGRTGGTSASVSHEDAYTYALSVAYLHYLLQPKKRRKEYVTVPREISRTHTINIGALLQDVLPTGPSSATIKLPHTFRLALEKRMEGVVRGTERMQGFGDATVKRSFADAYTAFTESNFRKSLDKDRKMEPLILMFYSRATKAQGQGKPATDVAWKIVVDQHLAMFMRLVLAILKELGSERDRPELMTRLRTLEKKLQSDDQDLSIDSNREGETKTVEIDIPHTYEVKDMILVQTVGKLFERTSFQLQSDIDVNKSTWTEEAALKDLKAHQHRLDTNTDPLLKKSGFDGNDAFEDWRANERSLLTPMMLDILTVRRDLAKTSTDLQKPLPVRPTSLYGEDQAYSALARAISNHNSPNGTNGSDSASSVSLANLSINESAGIRTVDEASYTFIPPDPRSTYKSLLQYAMTFDQQRPGSQAAVPLSESSIELMIQLAVWWRVPQYTRLITLLEVATRRFLDRDYTANELILCFASTQEAPMVQEGKRPPSIQHYTDALSEIPPTAWTTYDLAVYQRTLNTLHDALLRDLLDIMQHSYDPKPPSIVDVMRLLEEYIYEDPTFSRKPEDAAEFSKKLTERLKNHGIDIYHGYIATLIPQSSEEWNFSHVVNLGKKVTALCQRVTKRYKKGLEVMGVNPFAVLVETMFPSFEKDAKALIEQIIQVARARGAEVNLNDGFDLYGELVEIRRIHVEMLPRTPFAFHVEGLLDEFVWRWISYTAGQMERHVDEAIKQDEFQIRSNKDDDPDTIPTDDQRHSVSVVDLYTLFNQTVDQIYRLNWDDDLHHAKFMTALAKSFSAGVGRYCDVLEQQFAKEMNRQTAQDTLPSPKTTQDRFMQLAKDAWNTKEKIEPFQFYPESFVKLNNIEFAMQALDKLEKLMNVDQCVEVLKQAEGPQAKARKPSKYVFTVKIVEAEDIKACDPNGFSDPYVVLVDEYQKRLAKTRVITKSLNPRWDESVDIVVSGAVNIVATIWDHDVFGEHDFVGRTSLKLDPLHFGDFLPREFWLDLDTQGRLLLRVSMEGEKDEIQFHFGKAFRHLKRTERDMVRKITDKLTTVINVSLSHDAIKNLLGRSIASSINTMWKSRKMALAPAVTNKDDMTNALKSLCTYFDENFAIMKQTLTDATMVAVMTRLWKEVLMAVESMLIPPLSEKPSTQRPLNEQEVTVAYTWLDLLYNFFHARDEASGEVLGIPAEVLKSPKWHEIKSIPFFYFENTSTLIHQSESTVHAAQLRTQSQQRFSAPASMSSYSSSSSSPAENSSSSSSSSSSSFTPGAAGFGSMGTIRRGKSIMMSRNMATMRQAKEDKRKEISADPSDDLILRILRMKPEAAGYLRERHRQKERMAASQAAAAIVRQSIVQGLAAQGGGGGGGGGAYGRNNLPLRR